jgi:hypothetical protein
MKQSHVMAVIHRPFDIRCGVLVPLDRSRRISKFVGHSRNRHVQIIRKPPTEETPLFLKDYWAESENCVTGNIVLQTLFELLDRDRRSMNHE